MKPVLYCDFDGTICFDRYWRSLPQKEFAAVQAMLFGDDRTLVHDWMRGQYRAEKVNELMARELGIPYRTLWETFLTDCVTMHVSRATLALIRALRDRYATCLVTDNMDSFSRFTAPALALQCTFNRIVCSYDERMGKTDDGGQLFVKHAEAFGIPLSSCVLLDDSERVCETFQTLGGTAHLVTQAQPVEYYLCNLHG